MPGPAPAADDDRTRRNLPVKAPVDVVVVPAYEVGVIPDHPRGLSRRLIDEWETFWCSNLSRLVASTDMPALNRLWEYRQKHAEYLELLERALLAEGSKGQFVVNPALGAAMQLEKAIAALEDRFAQTVKARQNTGIRMGALADVAKRHPELANQEPSPRADPRLTDSGSAAADPRPDGGGLDGAGARPRRG